MEDISIVVTTYNRPALLKSIVAHLLHYDSPMKIHVFDNGSDIETIDVCRMFMESFDRVVYHRSGVNRGFDLSMANISSCANYLGKYSVWLADDDYFRLDDMSSILEIINEHNPDFIQYNFGEFYRENGKIIFYSSNHGKNEKKVKVFLDPNSYFDEMWKVVPPFCGVIVRNDAFHPEVFLKYQGTYHAYAGALAEIAASRSADGRMPSIVHVNDPNSPFGFFLGQDGKTWTGQNAGVLSGIRRLMNLLPDVYHNQIMNLWPSYKELYFNHESSLAFLEREIAKERFYFDV